jgi:hypothetical protein
MGSVRRAFRDGSAGDAGVNRGAEPFPTVRVELSQAPENGAQKEFHYENRS